MLDFWIVLVVVDIRDNEWPCVTLRYCELHGYWRRVYVDLWVPDLFPYHTFHYFRHFRRGRWQAQINLIWLRPRRAFIFLWLILLHFLFWIFFAHNAGSSVNFARRDVRFIEILIHCYWVVPIAISLSIVCIPLTLPIYIRVLAVGVYLGRKWDVCIA